MNFIKTISYQLFGITITYLIYVFPYDVFTSLILEKEIIQFTSILLSMTIYIFFIIYFRSRRHNFFIRIFIYEGMGIGFISLCIAILALLIQFITDISNIYIFVICIVILIFLIIKSLIGGISIKQKKIFFFSDKIKKKTNIIFISDVHLGSNSNKHLNNILSKIKKTNAQMLLIGGDLIDSSAFDIKDLEIFNKFERPIFYVTGNHEYYLENWFSIKKNLKKLNIIQLNNKSKKINEVNIIGVDDNLNIDEQKIVIKKKSRKKLFNLVVVHKPSVWKYSHKFSDLMLSGHTHNGQIFPFGLIVKLRFKNLYGKYQNDLSNLYVSSGVGCWGPKMRLGTSNEIVEITIKPK